MDSNQLRSYINVRENKLNCDEIKVATDTMENPQIDHIVYENGNYTMWDFEGNSFSFSKR